MKKKSETPVNKEKLEPITSQKNKIPIDKISRMLDIPEEELKNLPDFVLQKIIEITVKKESYYEGPLPPPNDVRKYEKILPGTTLIALVPNFISGMKKNLENRVEKK